IPPFIHHIGKHVLHEDLGIRRQEHVLVVERCQKPRLCVSQCQKHRVQLGGRGHFASSLIGRKLLALATRNRLPPDGLCTIDQRSGKTGHVGPYLACSPLSTSPATSR